MKTENIFLKHKTAPACFVSVEVSQRTPLKTLRPFVSPWAMGFYTGFGLALVVLNLLTHYEPVIRLQLAHPIPFVPFATQD